MLFPRDQNELTIFRACLIWSLKIYFRLLVLSVTKFQQLASNNQVKIIKVQKLQQNTHVVYSLENILM